MSDDPAEAAERLEAALERIAALLPGSGPGVHAPTPEIARRLDSVIARLRTALDADEPPPTSLSAE